MKAKTMVEKYYVPPHGRVDSHAYPKIRVDTHNLTDDMLLVEVYAFDESPVSTNEIPFWYSSHRLSGCC